MSEKRNPYVGLKCNVDDHDHPPYKCWGRGKLKCAICHKPLTEHETMDFCNDGELTGVSYINKEGRRTTK